MIRLWVSVWHLFRPLLANIVLLRRAGLQPMKLCVSVLSSLHHLLGSGVLGPAEDFSHFTGELLMEFGITKAAPDSRPHRHGQRPIETTLRNLTRMKNTACKYWALQCDDYAGFSLFPVIVV